MFEVRLEPNEQQLMPFYGMPVCLLMKDGSQKVGTLTACRAGRVILNGRVGEHVDLTLPRKKRVRRVNRARARKPKESSAAELPQVQGGDDFDIDPFGLGPTYEASPPESVPARSVESVIVL
jgi:hypothetical protein